MLAAGPGTSVIVSATGPEAQAAIDAIAELVASKFNEEGTWSRSRLDSRAPRRCASPRERESHIATSPAARCRSSS